MKDYARRALAYIAGRIISGKDFPAVYDNQDSKYFNFCGEVQTCLSIYDYEQKCFMNGVKGGNTFSIYHSANQRYISLEVDDNHFSGLDYDSGKCFCGNLNEDMVSIYDYENGNNYVYRI
jgi:hypothetical protein